MKDPCVYILASCRNGTLYIGMTSDIHGRMSEHVQDLRDGFTKRYNIKMLVYYEYHHTMEDAIRREKQLKDWQRAWKKRLIATMNPEWVDLYNDQTGEIRQGPVESYQPNN